MQLDVTHYYINESLQIPLLFLQADQKNIHMQNDFRVSRKDPLAKNDFCRWAP